MKPRTQIYYLSLLLYKNNRFQDFIYLQIHARKIDFEISCKKYYAYTTRLQDYIYCTSISLPFSLCIEEMLLGYNTFVF